MNPLDIQMRERIGHYGNPTAPRQARYVLGLGEGSWIAGNQARTIENTTPIETTDPEIIPPFMSQFYRPEFSRPRVPSPENRDPASGSGAMQEQLAQIDSIQTNSKREINYTQYRMASVLDPGPSNQTLAAGPTLLPPGVNSGCYITNITQLTPLPQGLVLGGTRQQPVWSSSVQHQPARDHGLPPPELQNLSQTVASISAPYLLPPGYTARYAESSEQLHTLPAMEGDPGVFTQVDPMYPMRASLHPSAYLDHFKQEGTIQMDCLAPTNVSMTTPPPSALLPLASAPPPTPLPLPTLPITYLPSSGPAYTSSTNLSGWQLAASLMFPGVTGVTLPLLRPQAPMAYRPRWSYQPSQTAFCSVNCIRTPEAHRHASMQGLIQHTDESETDDWWTTGVQLRELH